MTHRERRSYDHRIKAQVIATGNPNLFPKLEIPRSTASSWIRRGLGDVVVLDEDGQADALLRERVVKLERRVSIRGLALHAQRVGKVFAHPGTWAKLIRERGWGRPRMRLYPPKPKLGFRRRKTQQGSGQVARRWHLGTRHRTD